MKEPISELQATIRRLSPHLLLLQRPAQEQLQPDTAAAKNGESFTQSSSKSNSVRNELQTEAAKELVNAIAAFVWELDQLWESSIMTVEEDEKKTSNDTDYLKRGGEMPLNNHEPTTEWNDDAKSLIRQGYGLLYTISSPASSGCDQQTRHHQEELRCIVRTSILEHLLPSVNTSPCRHFVLRFLSHFIPLSISTRGMSGVEDIWSPPLWLQGNYDNSSSAADTLNEKRTVDDTTSIEFTMNQFLETFESLIQTDPSTLAPFLATMSLLFENMPHDNDKSMISEANKTNTMNIDNPSIANRKKCCHLCISSLPSISEHDLPSIIHSLFTLICDEEDGSLAVKSIRKEWVSINTSQPDEDSVFFLGSVIISLVLSDIPGAKYIAAGFLNEITQSLDNYFVNHDDDVHDNNTNTEVISSLDAMVLAALYSQHQHQQTIEQLVDSLASRQSLISIELVLPLIRIWRVRIVGSKSFGGTKFDHKSLFLYEELATSLVSLLFYLSISISTCHRGPAFLDFVRIGGLLPFNNTDTPVSIPSEASQGLSYSCCKAFEELYSVLDPYRQEQVVNSLLSMMTDSFVQSYLTSNTNSSEQKSQMVVPDLVAAAYSACGALLLISENHGAGVSQFRGALLDRLLLLASQSRDDVTYMLFDMNSALIMTLLQGSSNMEALDVGGVSEILILCQKLLFSASISSKSLDIDNDHRVVCGIILAARILRCNHISRPERKDLWKSVVHLMSPPTTVLSSSCSLNPEISCWGLSFLRFASSNLASASGTAVSHAPRFVDTNSICGNMDVFSIVNNMLASAGVIQMENALKPTPLSQNELPEEFLAFNNVVAPNSVLRPKDVQAPRFVICASYFLSKLYNNTNRVENEYMLRAVDSVAKYIYDLVDCYLQHGKCNEQGWNPKGWLIAKLQLPCALPESLLRPMGMEQHNQIELDSARNYPSVFDVSNKVTNARCKNSVAYILTQKTTRAATIHSLVHFMNSIVISISVSFAVLKHADEHFECQSLQQDDDDENGRKKAKRRLFALRKLIQYQLAKIQHLRRLCEVTLTLLKGIYAEVVHRNRDRSSKISLKKKHTMLVSRVNSRQNTPMMRISMDRLRCTIAAVDAFLESRVTRINHSTLWNCLLDDEVDDNVLCEALLSKTEDLPHDWVCYIVHLRTYILRQIQQQFSIQSNSLNSFDRERNNLFVQSSLRGIPRVFRTTMILSSCLNNANKHSPSGFDRQSVVSFLSCHFKLLLDAFSCHTKDLMVQIPIDGRCVNPKRKKKLILESDQNQYSSGISDLIEACANIDAENSASVTSSLETFTDALIKQLIEQFEQSQDSATTCHIIDMLSILTIHCIKDKTYTVLTDITMKALSSLPIPSNVGVELPYAFFKIGQALKSTSNEHFRTCFSRLLQTASSYLKTKDSSTAAFIHNLLSHWCFLVLSNSNQYRFLSRTCEAVNEVVAFSCNLKSKLSKTNQLPGLHEKMCTPVFELLFQMLIASLSIAKPLRTQKKNSDNERTPYDQIIKLFLVFSRILRVYRSHLSYFPRRAFFFVTKASLLVIKLGIQQMKSCVEWRSLQTISFHNLGGEDPADVELLQPLLEAIAQHCIGEIISFCDSLKKSDSRNGFGYKHSKVVATLLYKCKGMKDSLYDTCRTQNLEMPAIKSFESNQEEILHPKAAEPNEANLENIQSNKRRLAPHCTVTKRQRHDSSVQSCVLEQLDNCSNASDESSNNVEANDVSIDPESADDSSFGAFGDWG